MVQVTYVDVLYSAVGDAGECVSASPVTDSILSEFKRIIPKMCGGLWALRFGESVALL